MLVEDEGLVWSVSHLNGIYVPSVTFIVLFYCIFTIFPILDFYCIYNVILLLLLKPEVKFPLGNSLEELIKNHSLSIHPLIWAHPANHKHETWVGRFQGILRLDVLLPTWNTFCSSFSDWLYIHPIVLQKHWGCFVSIRWHCPLSWKAGTKTSDKLFLNCDFVRLCLVDLAKMCTAVSLHFTSHYQRGIKTNCVKLFRLIYTVPFARLIQCVLLAASPRDSSLQQPPILVWYSMSLQL